jgi:transposase
MAKRKRRAFTMEFKAQTVRLVRESGKSAGAVARELDLAETAVRRWVQQAEVDAGRGRPGALTTEEREELGRLRREWACSAFVDTPRKADAMAIMEPGKRVRRARRHFTDELGARYDSCWTRARRSRGSLGISTVLEARWQRDEGAQTGPKPGLPGDWRRKSSRLASPSRMIALGDVSPRARALLLFSTRRWAGSE